MWERIRTMLAKEFIQALREPRMRMVIFVMPVFQLLIFGYAATTDVKNVATALFDLDNTPASRELVSRFAGCGYFSISHHIDAEAQMQDLIDRGSVRAVIRIEHGYSQHLNAGRTASVQLVLDGTDSNTAGIVAGYAGQIVARYSEDLLRRQQQRMQGAVKAPSQVELTSRAWFNENLESRNFYVPGVMANLVMLITLMLTSMAVVREREIGTMEQIMVTPIRRLEFILGKTAPFVLISFLNVLIVTVVGVFWFDVPIRGSLWLLLASTALYLLPAVGLGLLISTICQTQQQAMMGTFFFFFPAMLLSGFAFPIANMPRPVQWLTYANPLRYFLVIIRGIFLKGVGANVLWPQMLGLAIIGTLAILLAARRFQKTSS